jgi:hypothetical protein
MKKRIDRRLTTGYSGVARMWRPSAVSTTNWDTPEETGELQVREAELSREEPTMILLMMLVTYVTLSAIFTAIYEGIVTGLFGA